MALMEGITKKRRLGRTKISTYKNYLTKLISSNPDKNRELAEADKLEIIERLDKLKLAFNELERIQDEIELLGEIGEGGDPERSEYENLYYSLVVQSKQLLTRGISKKSELSGQPQQQMPQVPQSNVTDVATSSCQPVIIKSAGLQLPQIELPKFNGELSEWLGFRDTFESLIHNNQEISSIEKFHYLVAALKGGASRVIESLEFSSVNYQVAWEALCSRYNNKRLLIQNHIKIIFNCDKIIKESSDQIRKLLDNINKHLRALNILGQSTDNWDSLLIYLLSSKLDDKTARSWESEKIGSEIPTLKDFTKFLESRASLLETLEINNLGFAKDSKSKFDNRFYSQNKRAFFAHKITCALCKEEHHIQTCPNFLSLSEYERAERVKACRLCLNCLRPGHVLKDCKAQGCKQCQAKHNTLLHFNSNRPGTPKTPSGTNEKTFFSATSILQGSADGILSTASVLAKGLGGKQSIARVLLDTGSQCNLITADLCEKLKLKKIPINVNIGSISDCPLVVKHRCEIEIVSQSNSFKLRLSCLVVPKIKSEMPDLPVDSGSLGVPSHIRLADPDFNRSRNIDIFIGNAIFWSLICIGQIQLDRDGLLLQKTKLGWIIAGPTPGLLTKQVSCNFVDCVNIEKQINRFWEMEELSSGDRVLSLEEKSCESHFIRNTKRDGNGRFIVSIPFKDDIAKLGDSRKIAERRLLSLERKLGRQPELKSEYCSFMQEYIDLGHMSKVTESKEASVSYYLPHHCVVRPEKISSKIRVVFDASATTDSGVSLNDLQMIGPTLQDDLFSILARFRKHKFVITADIEKMYRQVLVSSEQRALQRILWRFEPEEPIEAYEMNTVTYGTAAGSFLSIRYLFSMATECEIENPQLAKIIRKDFYVDDFISGTETEDEAISIAKELTQVLASGCFNLRKWNSNSEKIVKEIVGAKKLNKHIDLSGNEQTKTLGLMWETHSDTLKYVISLSDSSKVTKRQILAVTGQIFDPLGLLGPCIVLAKILLQQLWREKLSWDETLPYQLHSQWQSYKNQLASLNSLSIPRLAIPNGVCIQMHGFSDASKVAYGGCVYIRSRDIQGRVTVRLLASKSKVAPLKTQTIPRLELCGAVLVAKLCNKLKMALDVNDIKIYYWTDSTIVLSWIRSQPGNFQTFVSNRVGQIQEVTQVDDWKHVPTKLNPADCLSRGVAPDQMNGMSLWWSGPSFLCEDESEWPNVPTPIQELPDVKAFHTCKNGKVVDDSIFEKFESLSRLIRVTAYCKRFIRNAKSKANRVTNHLSVVELSEALISLARLSQRVSFQAEIDLLKKGEIIQKGKLRALNSFLDDSGTLRVGGRIRNSNLSEHKKHPIVIDAKHNFSRLLFRNEHIKFLHAPANLLLTIVRETFWTIGGRNLSRKVVHDCVRCCRFNMKTITPMMGDLPATRVTPSYPFCNTGVDYAGPFLIKDRKGRGCKVTKCYVSLFVCFATKAIHLELVTDATTDAFLAALRRFISRRGKPAHISSDNGKNFVGGNNELQRLGQFLIQESNSLSEKVANFGIQWHFIPAYSPHFGGIWEAGVKSIKYHLKRVAGNAILTFEELNTLLNQVEAILNSRPLTPLSIDPNDFSPLTPAHFLIGRSFTAIADPDLTEMRENRLSNWQRIQQLQQHIWKRWSKEYVSELQRRTKWQTPYPLVDRDTLVLLKEDNTPPSSWRLGRIVQMHPGADGVNRVASIRTTKGIVRRALTRLCPLPKS